MFRERERERLVFVAAYVNIYINLELGLPRCFSGWLLIELICNDPEIRPQLSRLSSLFLNILKVVLPLRERLTLQTQNPEV